ncbi:MAG TPA: metallophosphoesterase [Polyangiaceae bacterium]
MGRTVVVGDVHGCADELARLLALVKFAEGTDRVVLVGDLVVRGPDPHGVLAVVRRLGARAARGNHEAKLLAWKQKGKPLGPDHERVAKALSPDEWRLLESLPLWIDLPEHGARVVHAGVVPGVDVEDAPEEALLKMRTIDARGRWSDEPDAGQLWGATYEGPPHVVFGHNARREPQLHAWATGLDTGCVYGGRLTGLVLDEGEAVPRGDLVATRLKSVGARRSYYGDNGGPLSR